MPTYYMNEGAFDLAEAGYVDRTVHVLDADLGGGDRLDLAVARAAIPEGQSLREVVRGHLDAAAKDRDGYAVLEDVASEVSGAPAIAVRVRWRADGKIVYEHQAHLMILDAWVRFAATAPLTHRAACDGVLGSVLASVRLRD